MSPSLKIFPPHSAYYFKAIPQTFGFVLLPLLLLSSVLPILRRKTLPPPLPGVYHPLFNALLLAVLLFYITVPAGLDARYLLPALPFAIPLSFSLLERASPAIVPLLSRWSGQPATRAAMAAPILLTLLTSALIILENGMPVGKKFTGCHQSLAAIVTAESQGGGSRWQNGRKTVLVSSDPKGEGALVAEGCLSWPGNLSFRRSSKVLAQSDWLGRGYKSTFRNSAQLKEYLRNEIDFVIVDTGIPKYLQHPHHDLLQSTLAETTTRAFHPYIHYRFQP